MVGSKLLSFVSPILEINGGLRRADAVEPSNRVGLVVTAKMATSELGTST